MTPSDIAERLSEAQATAFGLAKFEPRGVIPARRFVNEAGQTIYSKVRAGTMDYLTDAEADCFLCHSFAVVEATDVAAALRKLGEQP